LAANRLGECIAFAHSGITAEGDNRVLMQKVTKEVMSMGLLLLIIIILV
jgi:acyl-CoA oxidase